MPTRAGAALQEPTPPDVSGWGCYATVVFLSSTASRPGLSRFSPLPTLGSLAESFNLGIEYRTGSVSSHDEARGAHRGDPDVKARVDPAGDREQEGRRTPASNRTQSDGPVCEGSVRSGPSYPARETASG